MLKNIQTKTIALFINYSLIGTKTNNPKDFNDFIIKKNSIGMFSALVFLLASFYHAIVGVYTDAYLYFITSIVMMSSLFVNHIKYLYIFKLITLAILNFIVLVVCLFFKKNEIYIFIFFIMIYTINILFSSKKHLYITILTIQSLCFIFLVHFKEHIFNELPLVDNNVFSNFIFFILLFLGINGIATHINHQKDKTYLKNKAKLFKSNTSIKKLNTEIEQLNVAALHSLKTPIYVAHDFIKKLHTNYISNVHHENEYEYEELVKNSIALSQMYIENLTTYTKIITETNTKTRFNILEKITFITKIVTKKFENTSIVIDCDNFYVTTNDFCFIIILENLLTNGLKYNTNLNKKIEIHVTKSEFEVQISVTDNGIGIESIYFERIFSPFVRIQQKQQTEGTGLGLSSVKMAARKMNGNVKVKASNSLGTTFEFTFKNL